MRGGREGNGDRIDFGTFEDWIGLGGIRLDERVFKIITGLIEKCSKGHEKLEKDTKS